jgi:hypothetical protein
MSHKAQEDLAYIKALMLETRRAASVSGGYFIIWGLAVGLGLALTWWQVVGDVPYQPFLTWVPCLLVAMVANVYWVRRDQRQATQGRAGYLVGMIWAGLGVTQLIFFFAGFGVGALPGAILPAVFASLIGTGMFLTGVLAGLGWLRNTALGWWLGSVLMFVWPGQHAILLMGVLLLLLYVLPGVVLIRLRGQHAHGAEV